MTEEAIRPTDLLDRPISVGDYVAFYSNVYIVEALGKARGNGMATIKIVLYDRSPTTKPVKKYSKDMLVLDKNHVLMWQIKHGK